MNIYHLDESMKKIQLLMLVECTVFITQLELFSNCEFTVLANINYYAGKQVASVWQHNDFSTVVIY